MHNNSVKTLHTFDKSDKNNNFATFIKVQFKPPVDSIEISNNEFSDKPYVTRS